MVEEFGMPHFLKTLTIDEIHKHKNIKKFVDIMFLSLQDLKSYL
jgi:hypothetical protein